MNLPQRLLAMFFAALLSMNVQAAERGTPAEAQALLNKAIAHLKSTSKDQALAQFSDKQGGFVDRDLYVVVTDQDGKTVANGGNPRLIGKVNLNLQDADGKYPTRERLEIANAKGKGVQEYRFLNPISKEIEHKVMLFEKVGDLIVACGYYKS